MKQHCYRITVEHLADAKGEPSAYAEPLQFEAGSHDDLFVIVERIRARGEFDADTAAALAIGLKLFGGVMMAHRDHPLFAELAPHFGAFMKRLKQGAAGD